MAFESLTKYPQGLIGALGLRDSGQTPRTLLGELRGVIECNQFYLLNERNIVNLGAVAAPVLGSNALPAATAIVPSGEVWYVWHYSLDITLAVATAIAFRPAIAIDGLGYNMVLSAQYEAFAASESARVGATLTPFLAGPGSHFAFHVRSITGAPGTVDARAVVTRLKI